MGPHPHHLSHDLRRCPRPRPRVRPRHRHRPRQISRRSSNPRPHRPPPHHHHPPPHYHHPPPHHHHPPPHHHHPPPHQRPSYAGRPLPRSRTLHPAPTSARPRAGQQASTRLRRASRHTPPRAAGAFRSRRSASGRSTASCVQRTAATPATPTDRLRASAGAPTTPHPPSSAMASARASGGLMRPPRRIGAFSGRATAPTGPPQRPSRPPRSGLQAGVSAERPPHDLLTCGN
jgi:hypothetical protein